MNGCYREPGPHPKCPIVGVRRHGRKWWKAAVRRTVEGQCWDGIRKSMAAEFISRIVAQLGMDGALQFREKLDCAYTTGSEVLKLFHPRPRGLVGGVPGARKLDGYIGIVLRDEVPTPNSAGAIARPNSMSLCPLMNLPRLVALSALVDGDISRDFAVELRHHLAALPDTICEIANTLGADFLQRSVFDRVVPLAQFLRSVPERCRPMEV
jgi:hypothetical protein